MAQSDLSFYTPLGWYDCVVATTAPIGPDDVVVQLETLPDYWNLYLSFATTNHGEGLSGAYSVTVCIDGEFFRTLDLDPIQAPSYKKYSNLDIGSFSAGDHTLEMTIAGSEEEDTSDNCYQCTFSVKDTGRGKYFQNYYGGTSQSLDFSKSFDLDYGKYTFSGNFIGTEVGRKVNAQVIICNSSNLIIGLINVKKGKFKDKELVLTKGTYNVYVLSTDNQKTADTVTFSVSGEVYYKSDYDDNSIAQIKDKYSDRYTVTVLDSPRTLVSNGWVGLGDTQSLRRLDFAYSGRYTFTINTTDKVKVTLIKETTSGGRKKVTSKTVSTKSKYGKDISFGGVLLERGTYYYLQVEALKASKGTNADYSVKISSKSVFYTDCDNGDNNYLYDKKQTEKWNSKVLHATPLEIDDTFLEEGKSAIQIDTDEKTIVEHDNFTNYVGFGDAMDFRKIELKSAAKLSFDISKTTGGAAKLIVYKVNSSGKMAVANSKLTVSVKAKKSDGILSKQVVLEKGVYFIAVQSTDAKKGKEAYYNVNLNADSVFYVDGDAGTNNFNSKTQKVDEVVMKDENALTLHTGDKLRLDGILAGDEDICHDDYINFVGSGDASDIVRIDANAGTKLSLTVTATDAVSLVIYGLQKNKTLKALKTVKSKDNVAELVDFELKAKSAPAGQFYLGVTSANAKKGSAAYYNVDVVSVSVQDASALLSAPDASAELAMPEVSDSLATTDSLSFGQYDTDVLADASTSSLAELDDKNSWQSLLA